jgi:hypothetical protein
MQTSRRTFLKAAVPVLVGVITGCDKSADTGPKAELTPPPPTPLPKREAPKAGR